MTTSDLREQLQSAVGHSYSVERELGGGGMSRVYVAEDRSLGRRVVIKALPPELSSTLSVERFAREIRVTAGLQHPHIVPVLSAGAAGDVLYYTMPFVEGESLRMRLERQGSLPLGDALTIAGDVADALDYAHRHGVVHRDIKPENILLGEGNALVTDFGVARALGPAVTHEATGRQSLTASGIALGTPAYMSPEQLAGERDVEAPSDVYSLACVLHEMLTGMLPPRGGVRSTGELAQIDARLRRAMTKALALDPKARFQTAHDFIISIERDATDAARAGARIRQLLRESPRGRRVVVLASCLVVAVAAATLFATASRRTAALDQNLIAVAPFEVLDPKLAVWREGLVDVLYAALDGAGPVRVVSPTVVIRRWDGRPESASATTLGKRTGAGLAMFGHVLSAGGDTVRIRATLLDVATGKSLGDLELRDPSSKMDQLVDTLAVSMLRELSRTRSIGASRVPVTGLRANSLPALKAFLQGEQFYRRAADDSAVAYYEKAIALDPGFAIAHRHLGWARWGRRAPGDVDSLMFLDWLRAGVLNRGLPARESLLVNADSIQGALFKVDVAGVGAWGLSHRYWSLLEEAGRRYPNDPEVWYDLGEARSHRGARFGVTVNAMLAAFDRSIALDSEFATSYYHPVEFALNLGRLEAARRYAAGYLLRRPAGGDAEAIRLVERLLDPTQGRSSELQRLVDTTSADALLNAAGMFDRWPDSAETAIYLARQLVARRNSGEADHVDSLLRLWVLTRTLAYRGHLGEARKVSGDRFASMFGQLAILGAVPAESAATVFTRWLDHDSSGVVFALRWWADHGDSTSLSRVVRLAQARSGATWETPRAYVAAAASAYLSAVRHDTAAALQQFLAIPDSLCVSCYAEQLTIVQLLTDRGRFDEAAARLNHELPVYPGAVRPNEVLWYLARGRVNERLGNRQQAITAFQFVADIWRRADPELQPYVAEARRALTRLHAAR